MAISATVNSLQPLILGSFSSWMRLLMDNRVALRYWGRATLVTLVSLTLTPLRLYERLRYNGLVRRYRLQDPIFIIGHWRSGTTLLQNLLSRDPRLGYVTTFQTVAPELFLTASRTWVGTLLRPLLSWLMPRRRMMDDVRLHLGAPQEEEFAVANISPYSFYHLWSFPRRGRELFTRYALLKGIGVHTRRRWQRSYLGTLKKAALRMNRPLLVVKNPTNTGRIPALLELFPHARFIYLHRNPYAVFLSTRHFYRRVLAATSLQQLSSQEVEATVLELYRDLLEKYLRDRELIPPARLAEVGFSELEDNPLAVLQRVYRELQLPGFAEAESAFRSYVEESSGYRKNRFVLTDRVVRAVNERWGFAFRQWGYRLQRPGPQAAPAASS